MLRADDVIGLPAVCAGERKLYGTVQEVYLDAENARISGLRVERAGFWRGSTLIPYEAAVSLSNKVLIFRKGMTGLSRSASALPIWAKDFTNGRKYCIRDLEWEEETGRITRFYVSKGLIRDIRQGYCSVTRYAYGREKGDILLLPDTDEEEGTQ